jgi:predicted membrane-bound mannosyltransferase
MGGIDRDFRTGVRSRRTLPQGTPSIPNRQTVQVRALALVVAITAASLLLRTALLGQIPFTVSGDEAAQGLEAIRVLKGELANPFATAWRGVPTMSLQLTALSIRLFGQTGLALRVPWALIGAATIPLVYWLVSHWFGKATGLVAAALLAVYQYPIHYSRLGSNQIADAFLAVLDLASVYALARQAACLIAAADSVRLGAVNGADARRGDVHFDPFSDRRLANRTLGQCLDRLRSWASRCPGRPWETAS